MYIHVYVYIYIYIYINIYIYVCIYAYILPYHGACVVRVGSIVELIVRVILRAAPKYSLNGWEPNTSNNLSTHDAFPIGLTSNRVRF